MTAKGQIISAFFAVLLFLFLFWNPILRNLLFCVKIFSVIQSKLHNKEVQICVKYKHHRSRM